MKFDSETDYCIVGAGAAGCVVADRLSESGRDRVVVLEAGPSDWHPFIHIPATFLKLVRDPRFSWYFQMEPEPELKGRAYGKFKLPFPLRRLYRHRPDKGSVGRCSLNILLSRGFFGLCVNPRGLISTQFDRITRAQAERHYRPRCRTVLALRTRLPGRETGAKRVNAAARGPENPDA